MEIKVCKYCQKVFTPKIKTQIICNNPQCKRDRKAEIKRVKYQLENPREEEKTCPYCQEVFKPKSNRQVTCGKEACKLEHEKQLHKVKKYPRKKVIEPKECIICKAIFTPKDPRITTCSTKCRYQARAQVMKEKYGYENPSQKPKDKVCRYCNKPYISNSKTPTMFCSISCYNSWNRQYQEDNRKVRICSRCGKEEKILYKRDLNRLCRVCAHLQNLTNNQAWDILNSISISPSFDLPKNDELFTSKEIQNFKCHCGKTFEAKLHQILSKELKSCGCTRSTPEIELYNFLISLGIKENEIKVNTKPAFMEGYQLDLYLPSYYFAIEFHGLVHHSERPVFEEKNLYKIKTQHYWKYKTCKKNNIQLFQIFEDEWRDKREIIESMIKNRLKLMTNKTYARECTIIELDPKIRQEFFEENHISEDVKALIAFGLIDKEGVLVAAISFRKPFAEKVMGTIEIARLATLKNTIVIGGFQKLLKHALNELKLLEFSRILTYADCRFGQGKVYEKAGFTHFAHLAPNYYYEKDGIREGRFKHRKVNDIEYIDKWGETEREQNNNQGWYAIYDAGNEKYELYL